MAAELSALGRGIRDQLSAIAERGPQVVQNLQTRLCERVQALVQEHGVTVEPKDLAQRGRDPGRPLRHQRRDRPAAGPPEPVLTRSSTSPRVGPEARVRGQEIGREINTIGSKASDVQISRSVVEVKALLEKIRELVQNVE